MISVRPGATTAGVTVTGRTGTTGMATRARGGPAIVTNGGTTATARRRGAGARRRRISGPVARRIRSTTGGTTSIRCGTTASGSGDMAVRPLDPDLRHRRPVTDPVTHPRALQQRL